MPNYYWAKVVVITTYIMNMTHIATIHGVTPKEKFLDMKLAIFNLKLIERIAYLYILDQKRTKLEPKVKKCIFISYSLQ